MNNKKRFTVGKEFDLQESTGEQKEIKNAQRNFLLAKYIGIGYYVITPLLVGAFLGLFLDSWVKTKPMFIMGGIIGGTVGTFYNLYKLTKEN